MWTARTTYLPASTKMCSPRVIPFAVSMCIKHSDTHLCISGCIPIGFLTPLCESSQTHDDQFHCEMQWIIDGFLYPEIGLEVNHVPGLSHMPPVTYDNQEVLPPLNGFVISKATDADILFSKKRPFCHFPDASSVSLTSDQMHMIKREAN